MSMRCALWFVVLMATGSQVEALEPERHVIVAMPLHLRSGTEREWLEFPETPHGQHFETVFPAKQNSAEWTLLIRQQDVKQSWRVTLNGKRLGELVRDENDMVIALGIPAKGLHDGENTLRIESPASSKSASDDIRVGQIEIVQQPVAEVLREASLEVEVIDADTRQPLACRLTVLDANGSMQTLVAKSNDHLAVRPGMVFTANGQAKFSVPAGKYTIFAGRGFEYSLAKVEVSLKADDVFKQTLAIRREVPTQGYVSCDTHIHTLTHSGHGDATIDERMITLAGEAIELPIATDHNKHIDYEATATRLGVRQYFTPVMGNEVTTARGHFNIFPVQAGAAVVDHKQTDWHKLFEDIWRTPSVKVAILNHARDLHNGVRPFGPALHNAPVGENLDGWPMRFNAMEVVNSGATQSDPRQLFHDWMGLLNRGLPVTPVGSSDSHDVGRHFVGQGRTYIRCDDRDLGNIDVATAVNHFVQGQVMVSYGLLAEMTVNAKYHSGELALSSDQAWQVEVRVLGPHWVQADQVQLFANGQLIQAAKISPQPDAALPLGVKWTGRWTMPQVQHDVHLVAIATGPGVQGLYWRTAKPYQSVSPDWESRVIGCSGAIWLDNDRDGRRTSPRTYAERLVAASPNELSPLIQSLAKYDAAVAAQVAHLVRVAGVSLQSEPLLTALKNAPPATQDGFHAYTRAWRENEIARVSQ